MASTFSGNNTAAAQIQIQNVQMHLGTDFSSTKCIHISTLHSNISWKFWPILANLAFFFVAKPDFLKCKHTKYKWFEVVHTSRLKRRMAADDIMSVGKS